MPTRIEFIFNMYEVAKANDIEERRKEHPQSKRFSNDNIQPFVSLAKNLKLNQKI